MDPKYIQGTPEYREWMLSQLPPGMDPASLGIPGLVVDSEAPPKLGDLAKVAVPTSMSSLLMHGALSTDGTRVFTISDVAIDEVGISEQAVLRTLVNSPVNDFGETEPLRFRLCALCAEDTRLVTCSWEGVVRVYATTDGALVAEAQATSNGTPLTALAVFPDGSRFAVVANSGDARVYEGDSGEEVWGNADAHDGSWIQAACLDTAGDVLFTADSEGVLKAWSSSDGSLLFEKAVHPGLGITALLCLPDGRLLVGCAEGKLYICSADDGSVVTKKLISDSDVRWLSHSSDLSTLFTSAHDHALRVWRMEDLKLLRDMQGQAGYASYHAMVPSEDKLIAVTNNTVDIHTVYPWTQWLERSLVSDGIEDAEKLERDLRLKMESILALKQRAQGLLDAVLAEPLGEDPAALERMAVDNAEKEAKLVSKTVGEAVEQAEAGIEASKRAGKVIADALQLNGEELLGLKEEMYAAESDRFDKAARQAVRELKQAIDKCASATADVTASLEKLEAAPEMRKRASEGAKIHAARVAARAERLKGWPHDDKLPALENGCKWHFFLSHYQLNGGDQCMALRQSLMEIHPEIKVWYDQVNTPTEAGMREGVSGSETFMVFLTSGVLTRYFVQLEVRTALSLGKPVVLVHETDPRHGYAPIGDLIAEAPEDIRVIFNDSVAVPHYREHEYRKVMLAKILRNAALPIPKQMNLGGGGGSKAPASIEAGSEAEATVAAGTSEMLTTTSQHAAQQPSSPFPSDLSGYNDSVAQLSAMVSSLQEQMCALSSSSGRPPPTSPSDRNSEGSAELLSRLEMLEARVGRLTESAPPRKDESSPMLDGQTAAKQAAIDPLELEKLREQVHDLMKQRVCVSNGGDADAEAPAGRLSESEAAAALEKQLKEQAKTHALELQKLHAQLAKEREEREKLAKSMDELKNGLDRVRTEGSGASSSSCNVM